MGILLKSALVSSLLFAQHSFARASDELSERFEFNGFARVVAGYLDESSATFQDYGNDIDLSQQSLIALQGEFRISDALSISSQLLAHSSAERDSGVEWLYLTYQPNNNWRFKLGKLRTPFFRYSDTIDVGFAYPWISPPQQVYSGFLFSNYEGVTGSYLFSYGGVNFDLEAYYGRYDGEITREDERVDLEADEIKGLIFSASKGNLTARISATQSSDFFADVPAFTQFSEILERAGFTENAESLRFNGKVTGYQANINYDTLDYFLAAEWTRIRSDLLVVPQVDAYYFTAGYNFYPFQIHASYSTSDTNNIVPVNQIPPGVSPQLDQISFVYEQITGNLPEYDLDSVTLGARWDFLHNMSAKAEITVLDGEPGQRSFYSEIADPSFDRKATLYQVAIEWVF
ncbi:hypothetical protein ISG33_13420 [Glaciecola sp. MH2013]|uniref:hypothetical protein n=1 Tax=Glaciecola sp. MH2013 TaxID=2785524 RepID=UPI0018A11C6D|nr:hypothetical protein [Glaciecola sp. MH2013]MBF7074400.1 hypothetical protein [Glaciecola sp. MH2013]